MAVGCRHLPSSHTSGCLLLFAVGLELRKEPESQPRKSLERRQPRDFESRCPDFEWIKLT